MGIVSFDFDGVLHLDVDRDGGPLEPTGLNLKPNKPMIKRLREEARRGHEIWIVSARVPGKMTDVIWNFVYEHRLPVKEVVGTGGMDKTDILLFLGAIRHYDDDAGWFDELEPGSPLQVVIVRPGELPPPIPPRKKSAKSRSKLVEMVLALCREPDVS